MKTLATFWKPEEAHLLRLRLGKSGIPAFIQDECTTQLHPWRAAAIGGVRVQVGDADFERALGILAAGAFQPGIQTPPQEGDAFACCACGGIIPPEQTRCTLCGWSYEDGAGGL